MQLQLISPEKLVFRYSHPRFKLFEGKLTDIEFSKLTSLSSIETYSIMAFDKFAVFSLLSSIVPESISIL